MKIYENYTKLIGNTPLVRLSKLAKHFNLTGDLVAKVERFNPLSSVKDRLALALVENLEERQLINEDTIIIEPTSGNTGVGLAFVCAQRGYQLEIVMPASVTKERVQIVEAFGAKVTLTEAKDGMRGAIKYCNDQIANDKRYVMAQQFDNEANILMHEKTTAIEIINDTDGLLDFFVAGVGTGGTVSGVGSVLKETNKNVKVIAVEPESSAVLSGRQAGPHKIQGIGAGFVPSILRRDVIDEIVAITDQEAIEMARLVARLEGVFVGISSGAALAGAVKLLQREENSGKRAVVVLPDTGERYLSTGVFSNVL